MVAVYSTFLQRAYDMLLHDVALDRLHVVLAVDRAGLVGEDGETPPGVFDVSYLNSVPGMRVYAPANFAELKAMLEEAVLRGTGRRRCAIPGAARGSTGRTAAGPGGRPMTGVPHHAGVLRCGDQRCAPGGPAAGGAGRRGGSCKAEHHYTAGCRPVLDSVRRTGALLVAEDSVSAGSGGSGSPARWSRPASAPAALCSPAILFTPHGSVGEFEAAPELDGAGWPSGPWRCYDLTKQRLDVELTARGLAESPPEGPGHDHGRAGLCGWAEGGQGGHPGGARLCHRGGGRTLAYVSRGD